MPRLYWPKGGVEFGKTWNLEIHCLDCCDCLQAIERTKKLNKLKNYAWFLKANLHDVICSKNLQHTADIATCECKIALTLVD